MVLQVGLWLATAGVPVAILWAFAAARRRRLISGRTLWIALIGWVGLSVVFSVLYSFDAAFQTEIGVGRLPLILALLALPVAPLATAPLALSWNRHR